MSFFTSLPSLPPSAFDGLKDSEYFFFLYFIWDDVKFIFLLLLQYISLNKIVVRNTIM